MKINIKCRPQDFIVEEVADFTLHNNGKFGIYLLKKENWNTVELLLHLSRESGIPFEDFSYGGRKDRHALTSQYISIGGQRKITFKEKGYSLDFLGFMDRPYGPDLMRGNKFRIIVRNLENSDIIRAKKQARVILPEGFANYFDDQRFGSLDPEQGFLAEKLLKGHFNGALKAYMTSIYPDDSKDEKGRKKILLNNWKDWRKCLKNASAGFQKEAFSALSVRPNCFLEVLRKIPRERMSLFFAAYQSYIWNEVLRRIIGSTAKALRSYAGVAGNYLFYDGLGREDYLYLNGLNLPTMDAKVRMPDSVSQAVYRAVLKENGIEMPMFNKMKIRRPFFRSFVRSAIAYPQDFTFKSLDDELYSGRKKLELEFILPRGSYGTMLVKRVFSDENNQ